MKRHVLIYRNHLLPISETFIYNQTLLLNQYKAFLLGSKLSSEPRISLPNDRMFLINTGNKHGWLREFGFKVFGWIPPDVLHWIQERSPSLIHAHFGPDGLISIPIAEKLQLPLIVTFHGRDATLKPQFANNYTHKKLIWQKLKLIKRANLFIAVSDFIRQRLIERGFPEQRIVTHYIGVNVSQFKNTPNPEHDPLALFVGRLVPKKGCEFLIQAFREVAKAIPSAKLVIIGDGTEREKLEKLAAEFLNLRQNCIFLGAQSHKTVRHYMRKAWVQCAPSITAPSGDSEGLPIVVLEAMASGVPVVASRHAGIPEAVIHGETGFLTEEGNIQEISKRLYTLLNDRDLCRRMGTAGRRQVEKKFSLERQNRKLEKIYNQIVVEHSCHE